MKIYFYFELLIPSEETTPVRLEVLLIGFIVLLVGVNIEDIPDFVDFVLGLLIVRIRVVII